jgi:hypothetical protein
MNKLYFPEGILSVHQVLQNKFLSNVDVVGRIAKIEIRKDIAWDLD